MKKAFTLAEVLITLGIIGVVAAITMPTLIQNYKKTVYVNQLKKSMSTIENGFKMAMAQDGVENIEDTELFATIDDAEYDGQEEFGEVLKRYFNIIKIVDVVGYYIDNYIFLNNEPSSEDYSIPVYLADGSIMYLYVEDDEVYHLTEQECQNVKALGGKLCSHVGRVWIDTNGEKGPNQWGRDLFCFYLGVDGKLYPIGGKEAALYTLQQDISVNSSYWRNDTRYCGNPDSYEIGSNVFGHCAARIIENGWKMDY